MTGILSNQLQIWGFEKDFILFSDGSLGAGFSATPLDTSCWDPSEVNELSSRMGHFLNTLPTGISIQFVQDIGKENSPVLESYKESHQGAPQTTGLILHKERLQRFMDLDSQNLLPRHSLKIFIRRPPTERKFPKPSLFHRSNRYCLEIEEKFLEELNSIKLLTTDIQNGLRGLGIEVDQLSSEQIADLIYYQWNPSRPVGRGLMNPEDVRHSLLYTDAGVYNKGFSLSDVHYRILSLKSLPDETMASMASTLRELPFASRVFVTIHVPDQQKEMSTLQTERRAAFSLVAAQRNGVSDIDSKAKLNDLEDLLEKMIATGEKVFHMSMNIVLQSKDKNDLEAQVAQTLLKVRELSGSEAMEETLASFDIFSDIAVPNARATERVKKVKTSTLSDFLPVYGPWSGHKVPAVLFRSRQGSLFSFDPFSPELPNFNQIICGGSGSGKSFFTNLILLQMLHKNPRIFIIDIGGSYKKLCQDLDGEYIPLNLDASLSLNPFDLSTRNADLASTKVKFLVGLMEIITKDDGMLHLPRLDRSEIEEVIKNLYLQVPEPKFSDLRALFNSHPNPALRKYATLLGPWCGNSPYGKLLDSATSIEFHKPIIVFDLKGLESHPDLQAALLFMITELVWREFQKDQSQKKFLIFDECWKLLQTESGKVFIEEVFRTFRKYFASAVAISQNIDDFAKNSASEAILSNSSVKWLLSQKGTAQSRLKEVLELNDREISLISSLDQSKGQYSEAFLMAGNQKSVVVIEPTPLEYWIATTDPRDLSLIATMSKSHPEINFMEILSMLSEKYPSGVSAIEKQ